MLPKVTERARRKSCFGTERRRAIELAIAARNRRKFKGRFYTCGKMGHMSKDCKSKEANAFEASTEGLAETGCIDIASVDLNALEIGTVQLLEERPQDGKCGPSGVCTKG